VNLLSPILQNTDNDH